MAEKRLIRGGRLVANVDTSVGDLTAIPHDASLIDYGLIETLAEKMGGIGEADLLALMGIEDIRRGRGVEWPHRGPR